MTRPTAGSAASSAAARLSAAGLARRLGPDDGPGSAYRRLADRIRTAASDGRLTDGTQLPSERELASVLQVSRTTVTAAYAQLRDDGWLETRQGAAARITVPRDQVPWQTPIFGVRPAGSGSLVADGAALIDGAAVIDLGIASLPAPPGPVREAVLAAVTDLDSYLESDGYFPFGLPVLRERIARHYSDQGVPTGPENILVTSGAQHGLSLSLQRLSDPGDRILLESPTYPVALDSIRDLHRVPAPLALSDTPSAGWDLELMEAILRRSAPRLAYLIPDFQNPTGALMSAADREQVVGLARRCGCTLLIDESFRQVPFPGDELTLPPSVAAFDDGSGVIALGSVSKSFWGGLRIGWVRAAPGVVERLGAARSLGDMSGPVLDQLTVAHLLADPVPAQRIQAGRLAAGASAARTALTELLPAWRVTEPAGGVTLWIRLPGPYAAALARLAAGVGVRIVPGPRFGPDGTMESYIRLPFTAPPEQLAEAVRRLAGVDEQAAATTRSVPTGFMA